MVSFSLYPQHIEHVVMNGLIKDLLHGMHNAWVVGYRVVYSINEDGPGIVLHKECGAHSRQRESLACPRGIYNWGNLREMWHSQLRRLEKSGARILKRDIAKLVIALTLKPFGKQNK